MEQGGSLRHIRLPARRLRTWRRDADAAALCRDAQCSACLAARLRRAGGMNAEDWARLEIPLPDDSPETGLMADAALEWVWEHTTLSSEKELPNAVKLFVLKYIDLMASTAGVTSKAWEECPKRWTAPTKACSCVLCQSPVEPVAETGGQGNPGKEAVERLAVKWTTAKNKFPDMQAAVKDLQGRKRDCGEYRGKRLARRNP